MTKELTYKEAQSRAGKGNLIKHGKVFFKRNALKSLESRFAKGQISPEAYQTRKELLIQEIEEMENQG